MQSNGGLVSAGLARSNPIRIVESGPAAGVLMCAEIGREEGFNHVITFDMGGTTAKLGAIDDGVPAVTPTFEVDAVSYKRGSGLPLNITAIEMLEIGAGGGSIARTKMGLITVGPDSSGAEPGPICYGRGGTMPTITDGNLVLGYLNPDYFNGGAMHLSAGAGEVIERDIGRPLDLSIEEAAWGIHSVANANMERAMRIVSIERGRDPRRYTMVAFGGAGPLHATRLARALEIPRVIVPRGAGVGSALGLLVAKQKIDVALTRVMPLNGHAQPGIASIFAELEARAHTQVAQLNSSSGVTIERSASMHHVGQGYEIRVDLPSGEIGDAYEQAAKDAFYAAYKREYGYIDHESAIEVTDWYVQAIVDGKRGDVRLDLELGNAGGDAIVGERRAYFPEGGGMIATKVVNRYALRTGQRIAGPALVEEREFNNGRPSRRHALADVVWQSVDRDRKDEMTESKNRRVEPVTLTVVWNSLVSIADEMGSALRRTAFSEAVREGQDFSTGLFDAVMDGSSRKAILRPAISARCLTQSKTC